MTQDETLWSLIKEEDSGRSFAILVSILFLGLMFHAYSFFVLKEDDIRNKNSISNYAIMFDEQIEQNSDSVLVGDGETNEFTLSRQDASADAFGMIAKISMTISYTETSGELLDPCDEVMVNIPPNGMVADWENEENILADSNDNCEDMNLLVFVYPDYDGQAYNASGESEDHWIEVWSDETFGSGMLTLQISVDVNDPPSSTLPTVNDENEEIQVNWSITFFEPNVASLDT
ncbi:MAG: hypothetical protein ISP83_03710 [Candidatus Poseidonia sp.]|nr:hypothetical protein [Poseidonia sp.]MBL6806256.1 hypothetical protein [Poseidonia sp.]MBL6892451.1 hypothetical protein [Poseidonia sp.]